MSYNQGAGEASLSAAFRLAARAVEIKKSGVIDSFNITGTRAPKGWMFVFNTYDNTGDMHVMSHDDCSVTVVVGDGAKSGDIEHFECDSLFAGDTEKGTDTKRNKGQ